MNDFKIYLAGGMQGLTFEEQNAWRESIKQSFDKKYLIGLTKYHLDIINPCQYYNFTEITYDTHEEVMKYDLRHVKTSNLIIVNFNIPKSIGTAIEIATAYEQDIPVIGFCEYYKEELHPWLTCMCDKIFKTATDAVNYITDYYLT